MRSSSAAVSIVLLCAVTVSAAPPLARRPAPRTLDRIGSAWLGQASKRALGAVDRKVSARLRAPLDVGPLAGGLVAADPPYTADGRLPVYLDCSTVGPAELTALADAGVAIEAVRPSRGLVQGTVAAAALERLAGFSWVRAIRTIDRPVVRAGRVTTEGDAGARAGLVRAQGLDGAGVVVGVISDGIDSLRAAQRSGDLPAVDVPPDGRCRTGRGDEGTALLEIVHDVAPAARLLFAGPASSLEMVEAVECLVAAGADVIVDDLGFFGEPYFQDGPVAVAVRAAVAAGVSYLSSAGNEAEEHLEQDFQATPNSTLHDFDPGVGDNTNTIVVPPGGALTCVLQWNDPFGGAANDYDLSVLDGELNPITTSANVQDGTQDPIELVEVVNQTGGDQIANVVIERFAGEPRRLELFCLGAGALEHASGAGSIVGHPALPEVVAVGAIAAGDPGLDAVEGFSSRGPSRIDFPAAESRQKPDLAALDGVSISNAGGFPACPPSCAFFGTSAAAPHAAGVAALLLQKDPGLSPAGVQAALRQGAVDIGAPGVDDASGAGRLDAPAASEAVVGTPCTDDAECLDQDACTLDVCDPVLGCVSAPPVGGEGLGCRLRQVGVGDVCGAGELDARTRRLLARRSAKALALVQKAVRASRPAAHRIAFGGVARRLRALRSRVARAAGRDTVTTGCAATLARLLDQAQALARDLAAAA